MMDGLDCGGEFGELVALHLHLCFVFTVAELPTD